jgi:hypothetical protein
MCSMYMNIYYIGLKKTARASNEWSDDVPAFLGPVWDRVLRKRGVFKALGPVWDRVFRTLL